MCLAGLKAFFKCLSIDNIYLHNQQENERKYNKKSKEKKNEGNLFIFDFCCFNAAIASVLLDLYVYFIVDIIW